MNATQRTSPHIDLTRPRPARDSRPRALESRRWTLPSRRGFTLAELLVVIAVIAFLVAVLAVVLANMGTKAKEAATVATIKKLHVMLEQRKEAFDREMDRIERNPNPFSDPDYQRAYNRIPAEFKPPRAGTLSKQQIRILVRKQLMKEKFPQTFADARQNVPDGHDSVTESSELLYFMLTEGEVGGAPLVDAGEFLESEVGDTDGDGRLEFIDGWGQPLRFYRWPTRLFKPEGEHFDADDDHGGEEHEHHDEALAGLLVQGLGEHGGEDLLDADPDDPLELLETFLNSEARFDKFERVFHTPYTYHVPLIVSVGPDGVLGLREPHDAANFGHLASPDGDTEDAGERAQIIDALSDNITNRNQRTGD